MSKDIDLIRLGMFIKSLGANDEYFIEKVDHNLSEYLIPIVESDFEYKKENESYPVSQPIENEIVKMNLARVNRNAFFEIGISHKAKKVLWRKVKWHSS